MRGLVGPRYPATVDRLEAAILAEWERRWPDKKWRVGPPADDPDSLYVRSFRVDIRDRARAAAEAMLDALANR